MGAFFITIIVIILLSLLVAVTSTFVVPIFIKFKKKDSQKFTMPNALEYVYTIVMLIGYTFLYDSRDIDLISSDYYWLIFGTHLSSIILYFLSRYFKHKWGPLFRAIIPGVLCIGIVLSITEFIHFSAVALFAFLFPPAIIFALPWLALISVTAYMIKELLAVLKYNRDNIDLELFQSQWSQALYLTYYGKYGWLFQILTFPIYIVFVQIILVLFNQQSNAIFLAFIESKNGVFSEHYRNFLDGPTNGATEYVCTVASYGNPKLVKPIGIGHRKDGPILVNRQLQVCNAFEEWLYLKLPRLHKPLRQFYDWLQIPVDKWKSVKHLSNIMFILLKPLEWFCLTCLYLFQPKPESMINKQYLTLPKPVRDVLD